MSELQPARRGPTPRSVSTSAKRSHRTVDRPTARSEHPVVEEVWQRHGRAMFALALVVCQDADAAESVVAQAILDACTPADIAIGSVSRQELARYVYVLHERRRAEAPGLPAVEGCADAEALASSGLAGAPGLSHRQRCAIALALFGDHHYRDIASLMGLAAPAVAELMRTGLIEAGRRRR